MAPQEASAPAAKSDAPVKASILQKLDAWGSSPLPLMGLATLVAALHTRPLQPFPLLFAPALLFASYVNVAGYKVDAAGMTAAWSGLYVLLSLRRRRLDKGSGGGILRHWTPAVLRTSSRRMATPARRAVGTAALALGAANTVAAGTTYAVTGDRSAEAAARQAQNRWGSS